MYSIDCDLDIIVESKVIPVHSFNFMMASHVFRQMLQSGLQEAREGRIVLEGKLLSEFQIVLPFIEVFGGALPPPVTKDNVMILLKWADEYQMEMLTRRCEEFCFTFLDANTISSLEIALDFKLQNFVDKCISTYFLPPVSMRSVMVLMTCAEAYQMDKLTERCKDTILQFPVTKDNVRVLLMWSENYTGEYQMDLLNRRCAEVCLQELDANNMSWYYSRRQNSSRWRWRR